MFLEEMAIFNGRVVEITPLSHADALHHFFGADIVDGSKGVNLAEA